MQLVQLVLVMEQEAHGEVQTTHIEVSGTNPEGHVYRQLF
jgi:hypothetical protein